MKKIVLFIIMVLIGSLAVAVKVRNIKASTTRSFHLYGSASAGWGFTDGSMSIPGPVIMVELNDVVNLTLTSQDGLPHQFYVDYDENHSPNPPTEPTSPTFSTNTITYTFTANRLGNFTYYCSIHPLAMFGDFKVVPLIPEFQGLIILPLFTTLTLLAVILYKRRNSEKT